MTTDEDKLFDDLHQAVSRYWQARGLRPDFDTIVDDISQEVIFEADEIQAEVARQTEMAV